MKCIRTKFLNLKRAVNGAIASNFKARTLPQNAKILKSSGSTRLVFKVVIINVVYYV